MGIDKDKVAKDTPRFIQKGQFQKAIEEYRKVLSSDPRDIRTRLKLVDLYGRVGKKKEAIDECLHVADSYADQGFYLKAIAVYKQALRIDPDTPRLYRSMGELYVKQGLIGDALEAFKKVVELLRQLGQAAEAEEMLSRMEEMAPDNVAIKIHLAEIYLADGRMSAFEDEVNKIVLQLKGEGRTRKLLQAVEVFYEKSNRHLSVLKRLAELYSDLNRGRQGSRGDPLRSRGESRGSRPPAPRPSIPPHIGQPGGSAEDGAWAVWKEDPDDLFILEQLAAIAQGRGPVRTCPGPQGLGQGLRPQRCRRERGTPLSKGTRTSPQGMRKLESPWGRWRPRNRPTTFGRPRSSKSRETIGARRTATGGASGFRPRRSHRSRSVP